MQTFYCPDCMRQVDSPHYCPFKSNGGVGFKVDLTNLFSRFGHHDKPDMSSENPYEAMREQYRTDCKEGRITLEELQDHLRSLDHLERLWRRINGKEEEDKWNGS